MYELCQYLGNINEFLPVHLDDQHVSLCVCSPGAPLFDSSCNFTDPQTLQLLQHSQMLLCNLSAIFHCLLSEAQELTQKGAVTMSAQVQK